MQKLAVSRYPLALEQLRRVPFNTNFAEAVLREHTSGIVYADDALAPQAFLVAHPCGMSVLFGETARGDFLTGLRDYLGNESGARHGPELLQCHPDFWNRWIPESLPAGRFTTGRELHDPGFDPEQLKVRPPQKVVQWGRVNYKLDSAAFRARPRRPLPAPFRVARLGRECFDGWAGAVMPPREFWDNADDFARRGHAWAVMDGDAIASLAFSAFVLEDRVEIGIETHAQYRGRGFAIEACTAFIDDCLARGLEPVWSCRQGNRGSERTAHALGFRETRQIPYFGLVQAPA